jgi:Predicted transcriptional regulator
MLRCVRTTIRLDDRLLRDLKKHAAARGYTVTAVIEDAVRQFLARSASGDGRPKVPPFRVITFKGRPRSGVDLDDSAALLDVMEGTSAPRRR